MVLEGKYDSVSHSYAHSCRHVQCPFHGLQESRRRFHRRKRAFDDNHPFKTFILHYGFRPDPDEVVEDMKAIQTAFHRFDPKAVVGIQLHPKNGDFHLHVGVQSAWFDMERWLSGYWCPETKRFVSKRGPKKKHCLGSVGIELLQNLLVKRQARLVKGKFDDQPENWLWYVMRCKHGWTQDEILPKFPRYKLFSGLITRKRRPRKVSRAAINGVLLAIAVLVTVVIPLIFDLGQRHPPHGCRGCVDRHHRSPVFFVWQSARGPPSERQAVDGDCRRLQHLQGLWTGHDTNIFPQTTHFGSTHEAESLGYWGDLRDGGMVTHCSPRLAHFIVLHSSASIKSLVPSDVFDYAGDGPGGRTR